MSASAFAAGSIVVEVEADVDDEVEMDVAGAVDVDEDVSVVVATDDVDAAPPSPPELHAAAPRDERQDRHRALYAAAQCTVLAPHDTDLGIPPPTSPPAGQNGMTVALAVRGSQRR